MCPRNSDLCKTTTTYKYGYCRECYDINAVICRYESKCIICDKKLRPIGNARKCGAGHGDWKSRVTHKKCFLNN